MCAGIVGLKCQVLSCGYQAKEWMDIGGHGADSLAFSCEKDGINGRSKVEMGAADNPPNSTIERGEEVEEVRKSEWVSPTTGNPQTKLRKSLGQID